MTDHEAARLRVTFGEDAELYDRCRPGYPPGLFEDLKAMAGIEPGLRVLEIGCGTGQATVPLARLGCDITAVELSTNLAAFAERKLAEFDRGQVVVAPFEDWPLPTDPFDLVLAATSFHWIDPEVRVAKSADAARVGGAVAVISTQHVAGGTDPFFVDSQQCYERFDPSTPPGFRLPTADEVPRDSTEFDCSRRFGPVEFKRYEWNQRYTTKDYLDLLCTYSGHRALPDDAREGLLGCIADLIDREYEGRITKRYLTQLAVAHRQQ